MNGSQPCSRWILSSSAFTGKEMFTELRIPLWNRRDCDKFRRLMYETEWILTELGPESKGLAIELGIPLEIAQVLVSRKIRDIHKAQQFLFGTLDDLHDPYTLAGMKEAVERIERAIAQDEKMLIFGDYDVDGVLSLVILTKALMSLGAKKVEYFIPNRLKEGYGIKEKYIDMVLAEQASLVISVDCGIKADGFAYRARMHGIDFIVTDHHQPGSSLPQATAILDPVLPHSGYPDKRLAGIGIVFKLIQAILMRRGRSSELNQYLEMVSIGTIADVAELRGENRILVKFGLKGLEGVSNIGLKRLLQACHLDRKEVSVGDVGFRIGPRLNAAGRMGMADLAVELFFSESFQEVIEIVSRLDSLNSKRQSIEERIYDQALNLIREKSLDKRYKLMILGCEEWHRGVLGIVASKIKDIYHRPVLLFAYEDGKAYGSGRSIREFSLIECLDACRDFFLSFGGHTQAVGCEMEQERMFSLRAALNRYVDSKLEEEHLKRKIRIDAQIDFSDINSLFLEKYRLLSPFGVGNPKPIFLTRGAEVISHPQKLQRQHSKFLIEQDGRIFEALGWRRKDWAEILQRGMTIDLAFTFHFSRYLGQEKVSLSVEDIKI
jgi:single-stranded-DNA-specific exonuclease